MCQYQIGIIPDTEELGVGKESLMTFGIKEHIIFPEIDYDKVDQVWGLDVVVATTARTDDEARELLRAFNFPFREGVRRESKQFAA